MIPLYENYLSAPLNLPLEEMIRLHAEMAQEIGEDPDAWELFEELMENAVRYSSFRANWLLWTPAEKADRDASRSACHNSLIVKFNQLARYLKQQGHPAAWRGELGCEDQDRRVRKRIGDFACYLVFVRALHGR